MQAALSGLPECNLHHGVGMKWAQMRPLISGGTSFTRPTVLQAHASRAPQTNFQRGSRQRKAASL